MGRKNPGRAHADLSFSWKRIGNGGSLLEQEREVEGKELLLEGDRDVEGSGSVLTEVGRRKGRVGIPPGTGSGGSGEVPRRNKPGQSASPPKKPRAGTPSPTSHSPCSFFPLIFY